MTKLVRIENADNSSYKVVVEVWDKGYPEGEPDKLAFKKELNNPCDMTGSETYLASTRYIVVREAAVAVQGPAGLAPCAWDTQVR